MKKELIFLAVGSLLFTGCNVANANITNNETILESSSNTIGTDEMNTTSTYNKTDYKKAEDIDLSKAIIMPAGSIKDYWGDENVVSFSFNNKVNITFPASWDDYDNNHYSFEVPDVMNKDYIRAFIDEYKQYYEDTPDSPLFEDTLIEYAGDSLLGIMIGGVGEFWSFYTDSENDKYFSSDKYYKIGTNNGKSYYIFIHPSSDFLYGHGYSHPAYEAFEKDFYDKICKTAYVSDIKLY